MVADPNSLVDRAEEFIFSRPEFLDLEPEQRFQNVAELAIATAVSEDMMLEAADQERIATVFFEDGTAVRIISSLKDGDPIHDYLINDGEVVDDKKE